MEKTLQLISLLIGSVVVTALLGIIFAIVVGLVVFFYHAAAR